MQSAFSVQRTTERNSHRQPLYIVKLFADQSEVSALPAAGYRSNYVIIRMLQLEIIAKLQSGPS